jgi:hypothetical protein
LIILASVLILPSLASADFDVEFSSNATYTDNVLGSHGAPKDRYATQSAAVQYYPFRFLKLSASTDISSYHKAIDLGTYSGGVGAELIPLPTESKLLLYMYTNFNARRYRSYETTFFRDPVDSITEPTVDFGEFETDVFDARLVTGYRVNERMRFRAGVSYRSSNYLASESSDQEITELFTGGYLTLPYSNALDVEVGVSFSDYEAVIPGPEVVPSGPYKDKSKIHGMDGLNLTVQSSGFNSVYVSPRISRPLGGRTGIGLTAFFREFGNTTGDMVLSDGVENVSPWQSTWQGSGLSLQVKSYLIPHIIATGGFAYYDKEYIMIMDVAELTAAEEQWAADSVGTPHPALAIWDFYLPYMNLREDVSRQYYAGFKLPITVSPDIIVEPSLNLQYTRNTSNKSLYGYSTTTVAVGLRVSM